MEGDNEMTTGLLTQLVWLFTLAIPVACVAWTVTNEEIFRPVREFCVRKTHNGRSAFVRKFFYIFTCEYCFSHYVTVAALAFTGYRLLLDDWRGYVIAGFALVWIANLYMSLYSFLRTDIKKDRVRANLDEKEFMKRSAPQRQNRIREKQG